MTTGREHLSDPDFEPTDDQLIALAREAFAPVPVRTLEALARVRERIADLRRQALSRLASARAVADDAG